MTCRKCNSEAMRPLPSGSVLCINCGRIWQKKTSNEEEREEGSYTESE